MYFISLQVLEENLLSMCSFVHNFLLLGLKLTLASLQCHFKVISLSGEGLMFCIDQCRSVCVCGGGAAVDVTGTVVSASHYCPWKSR